MPFALRQSFTLANDHDVSVHNAEQESLERSAILAEVVILRSPGVDLFDDWKPNTVNVNSLNEEGRDTKCEENQEYQRDK